MGSTMPSTTLPNAGGLQTTTAVTFLTLSVSLNVFLASTWIWSTLSRERSLPSNHDGIALHLKTASPGWSRRAADAAEAASFFNCSGNGDLYIDTAPALSSLLTNPHKLESLSCECYECFAGPRCADAVQNCTADVDSGDPLLLAPFWKQNAEESAVLIPGWYRMSYRFVESSANTYLLPSLDEEIRSLHNLVGNAVVENKYIVVGVGSSQLLSAAVASLAPNNRMASSVVAAYPYYSLYRIQVDLYETSHYTWVGDANVYADHASIENETSIEFVTSPNNPDCAIRDAVVNGSNAFAIHDLAYYWPHFTAIVAARDDDVMLFTLSKVTGHAGTRVGWAIVKDYTVYKRLLSYICTTNVAMPHESQLRAMQLLRTVNKAYSDQLDVIKKLPLDLPPDYYASRGLIFHYAYAVLHDRWERLTRIIAKSHRFSLQLLDSRYCKFFEQVTGPSPGYAWLACQQESDEDCEGTLFQAGIIGRAGTAFGANISYARLSLLKRESVFNNLLNHLSIMLSNDVNDHFLDSNQTKMF